MQLNPALMPGRGYLNIPVIGSLNATVNSSSLGYRDIMDIIENSDDSDYFMSNDFMNRLDATNNLNVNLSTDILSAGWYKGKSFWSVNVGLRNDIGAAIPKTMFQFMNNMSSREFGDNISDYLGINETINGQKLEINSYAEVGLGFARNITDRLAVGGKVKMLLGIGNLKLNINQIHVETPSVGSSGMTSKASIQVDATLENSSKLLELPENESGDYIDEIDFGSFGFAGSRCGSCCRGFRGAVFFRSSRCGALIDLLVDLVISLFCPVVQCGNCLIALFGGVLSAAVLGDTCLNVRLRQPYSIGVGNDITHRGRRSRQRSCTAAQHQSQSASQSGKFFRTE